MGFREILVGPGQAPVGMNRKTLVNSKEATVCRRLDPWAPRVLTRVGTLFSALGPSDGAGPGFRSAIPHAQTDGFGPAHKLQVEGLQRPATLHPGAYSRRIFLHHDRVGERVGVPGNGRTRAVKPQLRVRVDTDALDTQFHRACRRTNALDLERRIARVEGGDDIEIVTNSSAAVEQNGRQNQRRYHWLTLAAANARCNGASTRE